MVFIIIVIIIIINIIIMTTYYRFRNAFFRVCHINLVTESSVRSALDRVGHWSAVFGSWSLNVQSQ